MSWKTLEKSGLEPTAPNRQPIGSTALYRLSQIPIYLAESIKRSASDRLGDLVP